MEKGRKIITNKAKIGSKEEEEFNIRFWKNIEGPRKLEIAWEMIEDLYLIRGEPDASKQRLRRSVENILRRES